MKIHERDAIIANLDLDEAVRRLEQGFVAYSQGRVQAPPCRLSCLRRPMATAA